MRSENVLTNVGKILEKARSAEIETNNTLNYCTNDTSEYFEKKILKDFLAHLQRFDLRSREQKPLMAKARRRLVFGASETRKYFEMGKIVAVIIPTDLTDEMLFEPDFEAIIKSSNPSIKKIYALTRRKLGHALISKTASIGMIGIIKFDGVEEEWKIIQEEFEKLNQSWTDRWLQSFHWINESGESFTWLCSYNGHEELLRRAMVLQDSIPFLNRGSLSNGKTPLIVASERGHSNVVKFLLNHGADEDISDFSLNRPIHVARNAEIAALLTYFDKKNAAGYNPIENAIIHQNFNVTKHFISKIVLDRKDKEALIFLSATLRTTQIFDFLSSVFQFKLEELRHPSSGNTILMAAVENSSYEVFKHLLRIIDVNSIIHICNLRNETVFDIATKVNNVGISRKLIKYK